MGRLKQMMSMEEKLFIEALELLGLKLGTYKLNLQTISDISENPHADKDRSAPVIKEVIENIRQGSTPQGFQTITIPEGEPFPDLKVTKGDR